MVSTLERSQTGASKASTSVSTSGKLSQPGRTPGRGALEKRLGTVGDGAWNRDGDAAELDVRMPFQDPAKKRDQTIGEGGHRLAELGRLVMLHEQGAAEIGNPDAERGLVERGNEDAAAICGKAHEARRPPTGCGRKFAFVDQTEFAERTQAVCDDGAAEFTLRARFPGVWWPVLSAPD